jgi:acyl-CoA dehydrogenase
MSIGHDILAESTARLFGNLCDVEALRRAEGGEWLASKWMALEDVGLPLAFTDEAAGGFGFDPLEALQLIRMAGSHALPLPLAETMLANRLLGIAGLRVSEGVASIAPAVECDVLQLERRAGGWRLTGTCRRVPWGRNANTIVALATYRERFHIARVPAGSWVSEPSANIAGLPRDTLTFDASLADSAVASTSRTAVSHLAQGATMRVLAIAGALDRLLEITATYSMERFQFGRPIGKFQVIQQNLAVLAGQVCAASAAADIAAASMVGDGDVLPIAIAKSRAGEAATSAAAIAHQVHGAIGFTAEHRLHFFTKLLWSCRDEFGSEAYWNLQIGRHVAAAGADALWPMVTAL